MKTSAIHPLIRAATNLVRTPSNRENITVSSLSTWDHTFRIDDSERIMNDLSGGSGVVMATAFDAFCQRDALPAVFLATPILERCEGNPLVPDLAHDRDRLYDIYPSPRTRLAASIRASMTTGCCARPGASS